MRTEYTQQRTNLDLEQTITNSKIELEQKRRENTEKERIMNDEMRRMMSSRRMGALDAELGRNRGIAELREDDKLIKYIFFESVLSIPPKLHQLSPLEICKPIFAFTKYSTTSIDFSNNSLSEMTFLLIFIIEYQMNHEF